MKITYSKSVFKSTSKAQLKKEILQAVSIDKDIRKEIARVFQMANRRIQNIEKSGVISPAVTALNKGDITGYSKFNMSHSFEELKIEYSKAIGFLRQPTSTATGAKQYNEHLRKTYNLTKDEFKLMSAKLLDKVQSISDSDFVERYLMRYKDFTGELETEIKDVSDSIEDDAYKLREMLDRDIDRAVNALSDLEKEMQHKILESFNKFNL